MLTTLASTRDIQRLYPDCCILDCRFSLADPAQGAEQYKEGHIPGAHYTHLDSDLSGEIDFGRSGRHPLPDRESFAKTLRGWGIHNRTQVIAYDDSGGPFAARLWWMMKWIGHEAVAVLDGGLAAWKRDGGDLDSLVPPQGSGKITVRAPIAKLVSASDVLNNSGWLLLDAREGARFRGDAEPLDPVAGRIPGAINAPFQQNLSDQGQFHKPQAITSRYASLLGNKSIEDVVCYCGSGVTAAHNVLAMQHAGLGTPKLYAGSWSEWITDPERPIERGPAA
ncbi:MAG: sulfurtransferase [Pseudomonadota bacterium]